MIEKDSTNLTTHVSGQSFHFEVDRAELSKKMKFWQDKARELGQRPGAPISVANPHSADIMAVQSTIYSQFAKEKVFS